MMRNNINVVFENPREKIGLECSGTQEKTEYTL